MNSQQTEIKAIKELEKNGYTDSYKLENGKLKNLRTQNLFPANQVTIVEEKRFEGMSNPADMSILYAIKTNSGCKGTLLVPYGPTGDVQLADFMKKVEIQ